MRTRHRTVTATATFRSVWVSVFTWKNYLIEFCWVLEDSSHKTSDNQAGLKAYIGIRNNGLSTFKTFAFHLPLPSVVRNRLLQLQQLINQLRGLSVRRKSGLLCIRSNYSSNGVSDRERGCGLVRVRRAFHYFVIFNKKANA